ncbi:MAG: hypothetical protein MHMPM18_002920 [Marteilia pararefringens]
MSMRLDAPRTAPCPLYSSMTPVRLDAPRTAPYPSYGSMPLVLHYNRHGLLIKV